MEEKQQVGKGTSTVQVSVLDNRGSKTDMEVNCFVGVTLTDVGDKFEMQQVTTGEFNGERTISIIKALQEAQKTLVEDLIENMGGEAIIMLGALGVLKR